MSETRPLRRSRRNNPVFDLPVLVGIEEKLFEKHARSERTDVGAPNRARKGQRRLSDHGAAEGEPVFDCGSADSGYQYCVNGRVSTGPERGARGGNIAGLRSAVAAQAILTFDETLQVPRDLADVPVVVQELTGSHYNDHATNFPARKARSARSMSKIENGGIALYALGGA